MNRMTMKTEMIAVAIIASMLAFADSDSVTLDGYTWQYDIGKGDPKTAYITGVSPKKGDIVIPSIFPNRPVSNNGGYVYYYDLVVSTIRQLGGDEIISVSIPNSVNLIYSGALTGCEALRSISFPSWLDVKDFAKYQMITNITINVGSSNINSYAFSNCYKLLNLSIPEGITNIGESAFASCHRISTISLPVSLQSIAQNAFVHCYSLTNVTFLGDAPACEDGIFENANRDLVIYVPVGSKGWDGNPESTVLPKYWPYNTEGGRRIVHIGETVNDEPPVVTNYIYSTVTNYVFSTVTNEVFHYLTVTNEVHHYTTVTNVVKYVPEPGASPDAGYGINVGAGSETVIAGAAGWDAFGVPDGMEWNKETGTLSGRAKLSGAYDLILVSGSGADTKIMRTTLTIAPYDMIVGYVGVAFSQSGAPLDNLKSYKTLPAGLKWVSGVLNGVPTKAQTLDLETVDGEPVEIEIKALPDSVVGTFDGCVYLPPSNPTNGVANTCDILGTITLSATAAGKISASVKTAKKTYSFSMASWTKFAEGDAFTLEASAELKTGEVLEVNATVRDGATTVLAKLSGGEFGGSGATALPEDEDDGHAGRVTLPGCVTMLVKDVYAKNGSKWTDEDAHALMVRCAGTYQFGFDVVEEDDEGGHAGRVTLPVWTLRPVTKAEASFLKVVLKDTGVATITGTLPDKTKITLSAKVTASSAAGLDKVQIKIISAAFSGKTITLPLEVNLMNDGSPVEGHANCGIIYSVMR